MMNFILLLFCVASVTPIYGYRYRAYYYVRRGSDVLDQVPLIDGHNDFPYNLYSIQKNQINDFEFNMNLTENPKWSGVSSSHTDLPRLREGKVGAQFWVAYVGCNTQYKDAVARTLEQIDVTKRLIAKYPDDLQYVTTSSEIMQAFNAHKIGSILCVEGGHSMDSRLAVLRMYYELGVRYMTLTHSCNTPWADYSDYDTPSLGLTDFGKIVVKEMNRLGMLVDISHVSKTVMLEAIEVSRSPVIFSHSSSRAVYNHPRNADDEVLLKLRENNGIIMVNFYPYFIAENGNASIDTVIAHLNYIRSIIGADHIGLGADYDGVNRTPVGLEDVSKFPDLFDRLFEGGTDWDRWTSDELRKLAGENFIRVFQDVETVRDSLSNELPHEDIIPDADIIAANGYSCLSNFNPPNKASPLLTSLSTFTTSVREMNTKPSSTVNIKDEKKIISTTTGKVIADSKGKH